MLDALPVALHHPQHSIFAWYDVQVSILASKCSVICQHCCRYCKDCGDQLLRVWRGTDHLHHWTQDLGQEAGTC